jgi:hypothetical protein
MSRLVRSLALAALGSILLSSSGYGQTAVVLQNANLRRDPSTAQAPIRLLQPQEQLQVLSLTPTNGYYNVATLQNEQGWVFGQFIEIDESQVKGRTNRNTNLRRDPSASQPAIRLMPPGEELDIIDAAPTANYYHVRTRVPEEGWAYQPYIDVVQVTPPPPPPPPDQQTPFPDARDAPTPGWNGPVFRLSQDYPDNAPPAENKPWKAFDFRTQADQYIRAVLAYAMEGNREVDWKGADNAVRKWYHAPWLHVNAGGREFVHGLTRERTSRPRELHPQQSSQFKNYAVGLYNPSAGFTVGRVWRDHENPDASASRFSDGAVGVKLLFTTATVAQVPYLANAFEWDAHVSLIGSDARQVRKVRLLQIDVAVRDSRADSTTGWVFGTFAYDGTASGATPWDRMRPVGLTWGNDPTLTPASGGGPQESIILNRTFDGATLRLGWAGRLNGPVDSPDSACLSCHGTAQRRFVTGAVPTGTNAQRLRWFRNLAPGVPFETGQTALDYSLQLAGGIRNFFANRQPSDR